MYDDLSSLNYKIVIANRFDEVIRILNEFDTMFKPSISERVINLHNYAEKILKNAIVIYVIKNQDIVGFIAFYANNKISKEAYITQIAVKDRTNNKNIAKALLQLCINLSKNNCMNVIKLEVYTYNKIALKFYKNNGFDFYKKATAQSIYMIKRLT